MIKDGLVPEVQQNVEMEQTAADHSQAADSLFADHVSYVREHGDALDPVHPYTNTFGRLTGKLVTAAAVGEVATFLPDGPVVGLASFAVVGGLKLGWDNLRKQQKFGEAEARLDTGSTEPFDQDYEIFRVKNAQTGKPEIAMRWYGPHEQSEDDERTTSDHLRRVANLSETNDVATIFIALPLLGTMFQPAVKHATALVPARSWLKRKKGLDITFSAEKCGGDFSLMAYTPAQLRRLAQDLEIPVEQQHPSVSALVDILRCRRPDHALVKTYDHFSKQTDILQDKLQTVAKRALENELHDIKAVPINYKTAANNDGSQRKKPRKSKIPLEGRLNDADVNLHPLGQAHVPAEEHTVLFEAFGLNNQDIDRILKHPDDYPERTVIRAVECAVYLQKTVPVQTSHAREDESVYRDGSFKLQERLLADIRIPFRSTFGKGSLKTPMYPAGYTYDTRIDRWGARFRRNVAAIGLSALVGYGLFGLNPALHHQNEEAVIAAENHYAHHLKLHDRSELDATEKKIADSEAGHYATWWQRDVAMPYVSIHDAVGHYISSIDPTKDLPGNISLNNDAGEVPQTGNLGYGVMVGNLDQLGDNTEYELDAHNMDTGGYWGIAVGDKYDQTGQWEASTFLAYSAPLQATLRGDYPQYISVKLSPAIGTGKGYVMPIPVLDGTVPVAANFGGQPVHLGQSHNGTFALSWDGQTQQRAFRHDPHATIQYWVVPDPLAHAKANGSFMFDPPIIPRDETVISQTWNAVLPDPSVQGTARAQAEAAYIRTHFGYSLRPLPESYVESMQAGSQSSSDFTITVMQTKKANCNVADTLLELDNPELSPEWGYMNNGDNRLSSREAHQWSVDQVGTIIDPTPPGELPAITEKGSKDLALPLWLLSLPIAGLAAVGAAKRRRLASFYRSARLTTTRSSTLNMAWQMGGKASFASNVDPDKVVPSAAGETKKDFLERLGKPHMQDPATLASIKDAISSNKQIRTKFLLGQARRLIKLVGKTSYRGTYKAHDDISGIL